MHDADAAALVLRLALGGTLFAHGVNHVWGGGRLTGTTAWFASLGMRPARVHALVASITEIAVGPLLVLGLLTPLACAAVIGTMVVALVTNHLRNGFFIFRPGEGYEYVLFLILGATALAALGGQAWSLDRVVGDHWSGVPDVALGGVASAVLAVVLGAGLASALLVVCWRPARD